jgi:hypothetical protein
MNSAAFLIATSTSVSGYSLRDFWIILKIVQEASTYMHSSLHSVLEAW